MTILLATTSKHKEREITELLSGTGVQLETLNDYPATEAPEEDGDSMAANARIKAQFYAQHFAATVLADDSGLEVDALYGEPGIHSARWAEGSDEDRMYALLARLEGVEDEQRGARYRCSLCLATSNEVLLEVEGTCEGAIALEPAGSEGFGYDPIFTITLATGADSSVVGQTMAQVPPAVKASVSHRSRAVREFASRLAAQNRS